MNYKTNQGRGRNAKVLQTGSRENFSQRNQPTRKKKKISTVISQRPLERGGKRNLGKERVTSLGVRYDLTKRSAKGGLRGEEVY